MELITKFSNRKLYSKKLKSYVKLEYLIDKVKKEESFKVICHKTNNDVTLNCIKKAIGTVDLNLNEKLLKEVIKSSEYVV